MSDFPEDLTSDIRLAEALRALPVPAPTADFDDRVLAALRGPAPWWQRLWSPVRPLLLGTSCSLGLTLLLLHLALSTPPSGLALSPTALPSVAAAPPAPPPSLDTLLDQPHLCAGSLAAAWYGPPAPNTGGGGTGSAARRPEPRRRASIGRCAALAA